MRVSSACGLPSVGSRLGNFIEVCEMGKLIDRPPRSSKLNAGLLTAVESMLLADSATS